MVNRFERLRQTVIWAVAGAPVRVPEPSRPERRFRRILHNIGAFDPDSRLITLPGTFGMELADPAAIGFRLPR